MKIMGVGEPFPHLYLCTNATLWPRCGGVVLLVGTLDFPVVGPIETGSAITRIGGSPTSCADEPDLQAREMRLVPGSSNPPDNGRYSTALRLISSHPADRLRP